MAETDPPKFAAMLMERLEKVYQDQEKTERIREKILEVSLLFKKKYMVAYECRLHWYPHNVTAGECLY